MSDARWWTLPLFPDERELEPDSRAETRQRKRDSRGLVLHVYWSAGIEAHALGALARNTRHPDEKRALQDLQRLEEERKALAAQLLETVWRVSLPGSPIANPDENEDSEPLAA